MIDDLSTAPLEVALTDLQRSEQIEARIRVLEARLRLEWHGRRRADLRLEIAEAREALARARQNVNVRAV